MAIAQLCLKKQEERRLQSGHVWIYSNEVDTAKTPLKNFSPGQLVQVIRSDGKILGLAYINPQTLLCARMLTQTNDLTFGQAQLEQRIKHALTLREKIFPRPFYRLVYGESDALPGLIIDRYDALLVVQITTAGMEAFKDQLLLALVNVLQPQAILFRNDHSMREIEGLPHEISAGYGCMPEQLRLEENKIIFTTLPWQGQKTGWFYDHRDNRAQLQRYVSGKRVLDLFSYIGGWAITAAVFGATEVIAVDSSAKAVQLLQQNAALNEVAARVHAVQGDVVEQLKILATQQERFDVIIVDPPAFIKKRKDIKAGLLAYQRVNELAMRLLQPDGLLIACSCSQQVSKEDLVQIILQASTKLKRTVQIIAQGHQGPDHPIHPAIPETDYLKALFCRVC